METITAYLDNLFATLPKTEEILHLKDEMLSNMEERYYELKQDGKSENEAIGIVISEFGNIDELLESLGIDPREASQEGYQVSREEAEAYLYMKGAAGKWVGLGVLLCITGPALLIFLLGLSQLPIFPLSEYAATMIGLPLLLICVAAGVGLFIYADGKLAPYKYMEQQPVLSLQLQREIQQQKAYFQPSYTLAMMIGVGLLVLSPLSIFVTLLLGEKYILFSVAFLLIQVAMGVFILIYYGERKASYSALLQEESFSRSGKEANRTINAVGAVVWPLATCIFLVSGLVFHQWHINWIIFPITGILFGTFSGIYKSLKGGIEE